MLRPLGWFSDEGEGTTTLKCKNDHQTTVYPIIWDYGRTPCNRFDPYFKKAAQKPLYLSQNLLWKLVSQTVILTPKILSVCHESFVLIRLSNNFFLIYENVKSHEIQFQDLVPSYTFIASCNLPTVGPLTKRRFQCIATIELFRNLAKRPRLGKGST